MIAAAPRLFGIFALTLLAACGGGAKTENAPASGPVPGYGGVTDNGFYIEPVDPVLLTPAQRRTEVDFAGSEPAGSIVIDTFARKLYHVQPGGKAMRYAIAVGREGLSFQGVGQIQRKAEWPSWQPTANMLRTRPDLYAQYANGRAGGADNPLGSRAMYLYKGGRDTYFRIHGTIQNESIGRATSAGCIRMFNQDVIHLYEQVKLGTQVKVRTLAESLAAEGPFMDDAYGFAVPNTAANEDVKKAEAAAIAEKEAKAAEEKAKTDAEAAKEREKENKKRLRECKRDDIDAALCPLVEADVSDVGAAAATGGATFIGKPAISATVPEGAPDAAAVILGDSPAVEETPLSPAEAKKAAKEKAAAEAEAAKAAAADEKAAAKAKAAAEKEAAKADAAKEAELAAAAKEAEKEARKRLRECKAAGIPVEDCPAVGKPMPEVKDDAAE